MKFGICLLPVIPMRKKKQDSSEMINQILFGETFKIIKKETQWSYISLTHDHYKGWICNKQYKNLKRIPKNNTIANKKNCNIKVNNINQQLILGSFVPNDSIKKEFNIKCNLNFRELENKKKWFKNITKKYLNTPYLWGGRTTTGIDCSGFTQIVYRFFNINLPRDSQEQEKKGKKIYSLQESKLGDLAFFTKSNSKKISHVGILLAANKIIHASGKVKINDIDETGIIENKKYTHKLHSIKNTLAEF